MKGSGVSEFLASLEAWAPVAALRFSRWSYAAVNTAHVFAIALVVGGAVPMGLKLSGAWAAVPRAGVLRVLTTTVGVGLVLAILSGATLFAVRATEYAANPLLWVKLVLVLVGISSAGLAVHRYGRELDRLPARAAWRMAAVSLTCWVGALVCGRMIAFVQG